MYHLSKPPLVPHSMESYIQCDQQLLNNNRDNNYKFHLSQSSSLTSMTVEHILIHFETKFCNHHICDRNRLALSCDALDKIFVYILIQFHL